MKIAACIVLYNPDNDILKNISSFSENVQKVYLIDNSTQKVDLSFINKVQVPISYHSNNGNLGIAKALNVAANFAYSDGFDWLLTMDQDSRFQGTHFSKFVMAAKNMQDDNIAIFSPYHKMSSVEDIATVEWKQVLTTMTSGNLLNLNAHNKINGFLDKLFIDYVDHEFCLRLNEYGFTIFQHNFTVLDHELGRLQFKNIFGRLIPFTNHNKVRRYFITRNRLFVIRKYFGSYTSFCFLELKLFFSELVKILLFEKEKTSKIRSICYGVKDFFFNKYGDYKH